MHYMQTTALETTLGFLLAVVLGIPLGVAIVFSPRIRATVYPLLVGSQMVPKVTLAPLFLVWFGLGILSKIMIAFLVAFFPIVIATALGMQLVDPDMVRLFRSMGSTPMRTFRKLRIPMALPSIFAGCKVAITLAVVGAIVGEFIGANSGLGYYIIFQNGQLDTPAVYAAIIVVTVMGIVMYAGIELLERLVSPHRGGPSDQVRSSM
jgi:NitT/TauT family transport system permease protein